MEVHRRAGRKKALRTSNDKTRNMIDDIRDENIGKRVTRPLQVGNWFSHECFAVLQSSDLPKSTEFDDAT